MDHDVVVRDKMTERYLLDELDPGLRDQFEEHFFDCPDSALDVRAGTELIAQSKAILGEPPEKAFVHPVRARTSRSWGWFNWLRPSLVVPVMAALLLVIVYQRAVVVPGLESALHQPQVLPWAQVNVGTYGAGPIITIPKGRDFLLFVRIPADGSYTRYTAELYNHDGKREWSLTIPAELQQDQWSVRVPTADREAGSYILDVNGVTAAGDHREIGKASFELQIQK